MNINNNLVLTTSNTTNNAAQNENKSKLICPSNDQIGHIFNSIKKGEIRIPNMELMGPKNGVRPTLEMLGYDLIYRNASKLDQWRTLPQPTSSTINIQEETMKHLGYEKIVVELTDDKGEHKFSLYYKEDFNVLYAMETDLFQKLILPKMANPDRLKDEAWLFNYQDKLCVSVIKPNGKFYHSKERIALVLKVNPENMVEIFPRDKLSPTGFRRYSLQTPTSFATPDEKKKYENDVDTEMKDVEKVKQYSKFQKNYQHVVKYVDNLIQASLVPALTSDNEEVQKQAYQLMLGLTSLGKEMAWEPLEGIFHLFSPLSHRVWELKNFIENEEPGSINPPLNSNENYRAIFNIPGDQIVKNTVLKELDCLLDLTIALDNEYKALNKIVLHRRAAEWGPRWGHKDVSKTPCYLSGKILGRSTLTHDVKEKIEPYNEINVKIPKMKNSNLQKPGRLDIAALMVDTAIFDQQDSKGMLKIDVRKAMLELPKVKQKLKDAESQLKQIQANKSLPADQLTQQEAKCKAEIRDLERSKKELKCKINFLDIAQSAEKMQLPILCNLPELKKTT